MVKKGKGQVASTDRAFLEDEKRTLRMIVMKRGNKGFKIPDRYNTPPYNRPPAPEQPLEMAPQDVKIVETPEDEGAGSRFLHRRHPAMKPVKSSKYISLFDQRS